MDDTVCVDIERDLDLRDPPRCGRDARELEPAQGEVVLCKRPLALHHVDLDRRLAVGGGREDLALPCRDGGVALDQLRRDAAERLDAERERCHVEEQDVFGLAREHAGLDGGPEGDTLVGVDAFVGLLLQNLLYGLLHERHPGRPADEEDVVDIVGTQFGVGERLPHRPEGRVDEVGDEALELRAGEIDVQELGTALGRGDVGKVDSGLLDGGELDLRVLGRVPETLHRDRVFPEVGAFLLLELVDQVVDDQVVEVVAAEAVVAGGRFDLENAVAELEDGDVERAAAEVVDEHRGLALPLDAVGKRACRRLVDDPEDLKAGNGPGILRRLPLGVVEVGGHRYDGLLDLLAQVLLRVQLHLLEDHRGDLLRRVGLIPDGDLLARTHLPLDRLDGAVRVRDRLPFCDGADQPFTLLGERYDGRGGPAAFGVRDDRRPPAFHNRHARVGRPEIDTKNFI
ncbi:MAG: NAD-specific glutamate dehydrogenase [Euryarchaeota archaeon ADurb.Bin009]|nr:MAG: NAD-specific glutamate dehydrogenase [Euryarchaeota archaeon ADurb.Bin009]